MHVLPIVVVSVQTDQLLVVSSSFLMFTFRLSLPPSPNTPGPACAYRQIPGPSYLSERFSLMVHFQPLRASPVLILGDLKSTEMMSPLLGLRSSDDLISHCSLTTPTHGHSLCPRQWPQPPETLLVQNEMCCQGDIHTRYTSRYKDFKDLVQKKM